MYKWGDSCAVGDMSLLWATHDWSYLRKGALSRLPWFWTNVIIRSWQRYLATICNSSQNWRTFSMLPWCCCLYRRGKDLCLYCKNKSSSLLKDQFVDIRHWRMMVPNLVPVWMMVWHARQRYVPNLLSSRKMLCLHFSKYRWHPLETEGAVHFVSFAVSNMVAKAWSKAYWKIYLAVGNFDFQYKKLEIAQQIAND